MGYPAVDDDCNQTGQLLAGLLDWPQATFASKVEVKQGQVEVTREVDTGLQTISFAAPGIISCDLRLNTPKIATIPNMMKAKKVNIEEVELESLNLTPSGVSIVETFEPTKKKGGVKVKDVDELLEKLQKEAKVI
jgi:electron transfer flavoprotein beta subunit